MEISFTYILNSDMCFDDMVYSVGSVLHLFHDECLWKLDFSFFPPGCRCVRP